MFIKRYRWCPGYNNDLIRGQIVSFTQKKRKNLGSLTNECVQDDFIAVPPSLPPSLLCVERLFAVPKDRNLRVQRNAAAATAELASFPSWMTS